MTQYGQGPALCLLAGLGLCFCGGSIVTSGSDGGDASDAPADSPHRDDVGTSDSSTPEAGADTSSVETGMMDTSVDGTKDVAGDLSPDSGPTMIGCYLVAGAPRCAFFSTTGSCTKPGYSEGTCPVDNPADVLDGGGLVGCCVVTGPDSLPPKERATTATCYYAGYLGTGMSDCTPMSGYTVTWQTTPPSP
jgi:hypothetical protein